VIGREAVRIVQSLLPTEWTETQPTEGQDYGIDILGGITRKGQMSSEQFALQIKGTNSDRPPASARLKRTTVEYLRELTCFVAVVRVHLRSKRVWMVPIHDSRFTTAGQTDSETLSVQLTSHDEATTTLAERIDVLSHREWSRLARQRRDIVWVRALAWDSPQDKAALASLREKLPPWIRVEPGMSVERHQVQAELHNGPDPLLRDFARPTRPLEFPVPMSTGTTRLGLILATGFQDLRMIDPAIDLYLRFLPEAREALFDRGMSRVFNMLVRESGFDPVMEILRKAVRNGCPWSAWLVTYINQYQSIPEELQPLAHEAFVLARRLSTDWGDTARLFMNENYMLARADRKRDAFEAAQLAARCHAGYLEYPHWWQYMGGMLVDLGESRQGDKFYRKALALGGEPVKILPLRIELALRDEAWIAVVDLATEFRRAQSDPRDSAWVELMAGVARLKLREKWEDAAVALAPGTHLWQLISEAIFNPRSVEKWADVLAVVLSKFQVLDELGQRIVLTAFKFHGGKAFAMLRERLEPDIAARVAELQMAFEVLEEPLRPFDQNDVKLAPRPRGPFDGEYPSGPLQLDELL